MTNNQLKSYAERYIRLKEEQKALGEDIKELEQEVGSAGFDKKIFRDAIKFQMLDSQKQEERRNQMELFDNYLEAMQ